MRSDALSIPVPCSQGDVRTCEIVLFLEWWSLVSAMFLYYNNVGFPLILTLHWLVGILILYLHSVSFF